jgi:hypothetical protein
MSIPCVSTTVQPNECRIAQLVASDLAPNLNVSRYITSFPAPRSSRHGTMEHYMYISQCHITNSTFPSQILDRVTCSKPGDLRTKGLTPAPDDSVDRSDQIASQEKFSYC